MTIALSVLILAYPIAVGFLVAKCIQLGLRWQIQTTQHKPPELKIPNPIQPIIHAKHEKEAAQQGKELQNILDEWVNGAEESR